MINAIHGSPVEIRPDYITVLTSGGVEYRLEVTRITSEKIAAIPAPDRSDLRIFAYLQHREDAMTLFGFYSEEERFCFEQLQTVPGIGARQALRILSGITVQNLIKALDSQDVKTLAKVPGVGPKTAQKLILQLRNVLVLEEDDEGDAEKDPMVPTQEYRDMIESFAAMGHDRRLVVRTLSEVIKENEEKLKSSDYRTLEPVIFSIMLKRLS